MNRKYIIASFYKFVDLKNYLELKEPLLAVMSEYNILGTILLASEGINGSFAAPPDDVAKFYQYLKQDPRFEDLFFRETYDDFMPFDKAKVKFRKEIVTLGVGPLDIKNQGGKYLSPDEWNDLLKDPNVLIIDTRNQYEVALGAFKSAINPETENFRDFPEFVASQLMNEKSKKIAMYCTGGIRCEKSTAYLKSLGFQETYQLKGGILNYLEQVPESESLWEGKCFVFDERIAIDASGLS